ncbi:hypothetical protein WJX75_007347 [Coccomyxa subellipsoidea]|uniref:histone acetyltransferase n=1 Tax=Coccomyxa subellipsoidea TaxID=248742 RepID=A0ABR2YMZ4_9CHLO
MADEEEPPNKRQKVDTGVKPGELLLEPLQDKGGAERLVASVAAASSGHSGRPDGAGPVGAEGELAAPLPANGVTESKAEPSHQGDEPAENGGIVPVEVPAGMFSQRELYMAKREADGDLAFEYVDNDNTANHNMWLIGLKNIFSKQLPNMPKEYIARLVLDRRHRSVAIIRRGGMVLGGITYRPFHAQGFGEIAFCAVTAIEQVKGFGARLMNFTKEFARARDHLTHFLTYADNNAVGYFAKQGFTKEITLEKDRWVGYIKDYDGGTLMECIISDRLPYTDLPGMLRAQRAALDRHIRTLSKSHVVHPGLTAFQDGQRRIDIASIPGVSEAGWTAETAEPPHYSLLIDRVVLPATPDNLQRFMERAWRALYSLDESWPFREAVDAEDVPDYYDIVKDPVDLTLIEQRLKSRNYYVTLHIFVADVNRMCANARIYNSAETIYFKMANKLEAFLDEYIHAHVVFNNPQ